MITLVEPLFLPELELGLTHLFHTLTEVADGKFQEKKDNDLRGDVVPGLQEGQALPRRPAP